MMASLADRYQSRIDRSKTKSFQTKVKRDDSGKRIGGGTKVTQATVDAIRGYENVQIIVRENNIAIIEAAISEALTAALEEIGLVTEAAAKKLCPVDTGRLRNSITHAFEDDHSIVVGTNVEYATYVHDGTSRRKGTPFLTQAATSNKGRYDAIVRKHMTNG